MRLDGARTLALFLFASGLAVAFAACSSDTKDPIRSDVKEDASGEEGPPTDSSDAAGRAGFGDPCTVGDDATCDEGLLCLQGPSGGKIGFCTKTCPKTSSAPCSGAPEGTFAACVVTDVDQSGDKGCAFACAVASKTFSCPGSLKCSTTEDPPGSGQKLCLP